MVRLVPSGFWCLLPPKRCPATPYTMGTNGLRILEARRMDRECQDKTSVRVMKKWAIRAEQWRGGRAGQGAYTTVQCILKYPAAWHRRGRRRGMNYGFAHSWTDFRKRERPHLASGSSCARHGQQQHGTWDTSLTAHHSARRDMWALARARPRAQSRLACSTMEEEPLVFLVRWP
ncbi:hypothetical protein B0I35DRAFT_145926 [Stachybotrys elegans]|uniref:Uncharacterized protein n=1 Tax=Stachybotrys elegans TaxID=80388 RepID=A0A8K0SG32_9HYPO|nr:hypothetical protein B0I35DRAFT_145926 [Stachybotrys elegans]